MKLFMTWVMSAGLVVAAAAVNAQGAAPYGGARHIVGDPYGAVPDGAPVPGYGPMLLPPQEVYIVLRENGFSPLGTPQRRGMVYTIAVIGYGGDNGRLVIDARNGRIIQFMPAYRTGGNFEGDSAINYGPMGPGPMPPPSQVRGPPRPPLSIPRVANHTPPVPRPSPLAARPAAEATTPAAEAAKPAAEPAAQSAAVQAKPADAPAVTTGSVPAKPVPQIAPTREMPKVQGLD